MSSSSSDPKGPPAEPKEGATRAFQVKIDGWMADLAKDFEPPAEEEESPEEKAKRAAEAAKHPSKPSK